VDQRGERARLIALHRVARARDDLPQRRREPPLELGAVVMGDEDGVAALHDERRHRDARHVVPQGREITPVAAVVGVLGVLSEEVVPPGPLPVVAAIRVVAHTATDRSLRALR
jgi:hypothetical protein